MTPNTASIIFNYFPDLSETQISQFEQLHELYADWNSKINVISRKDIDQLYTRHVLHSLGIATVVQFESGAEVLDIGTGGGFPGIPLAILFPETQFMLVDSIGKKIKVVNEVAKSLGLTNVTGIHERAEKIDQQFDFILCRAVSRLKPFYEWTKGKLKQESKHDINNGILCWKGGDLAEELTESKLRYLTVELQEVIQEEFFETKKVIYVERQ
jgi:16S rRNA (guanine527-N7)-methyltransferase